MDALTAAEQLSIAVKSLESSLEPILSKPLKEWKELIKTEPLEQAKLDITLAYVVHDLIWIYLKTAGIDPNNHPVMEELNRVKEYFNKIKSAETKDQRPTLDKAAANRFIAAAIGGNAIAGPSTHKRFDEAQVDALLVEEEIEEVPAVVVVAEVVEEVEMVDDKPEEIIKKKSKRPSIDPFTGYDSPKSEKKSKKGKIETVESPIASPAPVATSGSAKKAAKNASKKAKSS